MATIVALNMWRDEEQFLLSRRRPRCVVHPYLVSPHGRWRIRVPCQGPSSCRLDCREARRGGAEPAGVDDRVGLREEPSFVFARGDGDARRGEGEEGGVGDDLHDGYLEEDNR